VDNCPPCFRCPLAGCQGASAAGRVATVSFIETWIYEFVAIEQGAMLQNLGLMAQALGLGGFPHFAAHPFIWFQTLGFRMQEPPFSRTIGADPVTRTLLRPSGRGGAGPDFGAPGEGATSDREPLTGEEAERHTALVIASWVVFDWAAAAAPAMLRKGPRGSW
jgi:hypothetical protein